MEAGDGVRLLLRASWQPGPRESRPALVLIHGLGGWDGATYGLATGALAWSRGWHVVRMNMRGAGDGMGLSAVLYNAGLDSDLVAVLDALAGLTPRLAVVGFSLGANLALLALGRSGDRLPAGLVGVVGVSPPLDLGACATALDAPGNCPLPALFHAQPAARLSRAPGGATRPVRSGPRARPHDGTRATTRPSRRPTAATEMQRITTLARAPGRTLARSGDRH